MHAVINGVSVVVGNRVSRDGEQGEVIALYGDTGGLVAERIRVRWDDGSESPELDPEEFEAARS